MEKIWLKSYPAGVPAEIDINEYQSVAQVFEEAVTKFGPRSAYYCMGASITFNELDTLSAAFGAWLQGKGVQKGDRVAVMITCCASAGPVFRNGLTHARDCIRLAMMFRCRSIAPLATPVVPPVYCRNAMSS